MGVYCLLIIFSLASDRFFLNFTCVLEIKTSFIQWLINNAHCQKKRFLFSCAIPSGHKTQCLRSLIIVTKHKFWHQEILTCLQQLYYWKIVFDNRFKAVTPFLLTVCGVRFGIDHFILLTYVLFSSNCWNLKYSKMMTLNPEVWHESLSWSF